MMRNSTIAPLLALVCTGALMAEEALPSGAIFRFPPAEEKKGASNIAFSPDGKLLVLGGIRKQIWDVDKKDMVFEFSGLGVASISSDGRLVAASVFGKPEYMPIQDIVNKQELRRIEGNGAFIGRILFAAQSNVSATFEWTVDTEVVRVRDTANWQELKSIKVPGRRIDGKPRMMALSPDGKLVLIITDRVFFHQIPSGDLLGELVLQQTGPNSMSMPYHPFFSSDGRTLLLYSELGQIDLVSVAKRQKYRSLTMPAFQGSITDAALSPDGRVVATVKENIVEVWEAATLAKIVTLKPGGPRFWSIAFRPDGRTFATGMGDGTGLLWDVEKVLCKPDPLAAKENPNLFETAWAALGKEDAAAAWTNMGALTCAGEKTVAFLKNKVRPSGVNRQRIEAQMKNLSDPARFKREQAVKEFSDLGYRVGSDIRQLLASKLPDDATAGLQKALQGAEEASITEKLPAGTLEWVRAVRVLEVIHSPEAIATIESLVKNPPAARVWWEADCALQRLKNDSPLQH